MKKLIFLFSFLFSLTSVTLFAQSDDQHEMSSMRVSIDATQYNSSRFLEKTTVKSKDYIHGKSSSYNRKGESANKKSLAPYAEYDIKSKLPGGTYNVTVYYSIDKDKAPDEPIIIVGMDLQDTNEIAIKNKLINSVRTSISVKALRGKNHKLKIWLPSEGVMIDRFEVSRAIINKK